MRLRRIDIALLIMTMAIVVSCDTANNVEPLYKEYFVKYYGEDGDHESVDLVANSDNTFVLLGTSISPSGSRKIFVTKVDQSGNQIWQKQLGAGNEYPEDIEPLVGGGFVILSNVKTDAVNDYYDFKLIRIDDSGNKIDSVEYDVLIDQFANSVTELSDGGFFVGGKTQDSDTTNTNDDELPVEEREDLLIVRFDNTLSIATAMTDRIGSSSVGSVVKIFEYAAGYFVYVASSDELKDEGETGDYDWNFIFRKFQFLPNQVSTLYMGDNIKNEEMEYATRGSDGLIYAIGTAETPTSSSIYMVKVNSSTPLISTLFSKDFGAGTRIEGVAAYPSGAFCYILANKVDDADGTRDIWLTRVSALDGSQSIFWSIGITFGTPSNDDYGHRVYETISGDIVILGTVNITNQKKMALIKVNNNGGFE